MRGLHSDHRLAEVEAKVFATLPVATGAVGVAADPADLARANDLQRQVLRMLERMERDDVVESMSGSLRETRRARARLNELQALVHQWAVRGLPGSAELQRETTEALTLSDAVLAKLEALEARARAIRSRAASLAQGARAIAGRVPDATSPIDLEAWIEASAGLVSAEAGREFDEHWAAYREELDGTSEAGAS